MSGLEATSPSYPIGKFAAPAAYNAELRRNLITQIAETPVVLRRVTEAWTDLQLDTPYREGGWTVRQVIHHLPDSHMNAYVRFKLAVTEENPTIRPYSEKLWAELHDAKQGPIGPSLDLLDGLHRRWVGFLRNLPDAAFERRYVHPESGPGTLNRLLALYAWHGGHHIAQIVHLAKREGWGKE